MNESKKTYMFVGAAIVAASLAITSHFMNQPTNSADFELVGQPFFEDFTSASQAQSLEVSVIDPDTANLRRFSVQNKDGLWRIPSHHDYPAEAAIRLAQTASSVLGVTRESIAGRKKSEHERLGVVDPLGDVIDSPEAAGSRITMKDADGEVVFDYIIGNEAGEIEQTNAQRALGTFGKQKYYYVRRPDEQQTYKVRLDIDLSTKFTDWIDPDLLRLDPQNLTRIQVNRYTLEEGTPNQFTGATSFFKSQGDVLDLSRESNTEPWGLKDIAPEKEELNTSGVDRLVDVVDGLKIAGVRPKFKFKDQLLITADLKLNQSPELKSDPREFARAFDALQTDLDDKGFNLAGSIEQLSLVARAGELALGTDQGVKYSLYIGKPVAGEESEIEIGFKSETEPSDAETDEEQPESDEKPGDKNDADADKADDAKNRYLMVRVEFDESLITPRPQKPTPPTEPTKPEGYSPAPPEQETEAESKPEDSEADPDAPEAPPSEKKEERDPKFVEYDQALATYEKAKVEYELELTQFEDATKKFNEKIEAGKVLVGELNQRFGQWYYVISADDLPALQSKREDIVNQKEAPATDPGTGGLLTAPNISFPPLPGDSPSLNSDDPAKTDGDDTASSDAKTGEKMEPSTDDPKTEKSDDGKAEKSESEKPKSDKSEAEKSDSKDGDADDSEANEAESEKPADSKPADTNQESGESKSEKSKSDESESKEDDNS